MSKSQTPNCYEDVLVYKCNRCGNVIRTVNSIAGTVCKEPLFDNKWTLMKFKGYCKGKYKFVRKEKDKR